MKEPKPIRGTKTIKVITGWRGKCEQCSKAMKAKRKDARTCSDACRMRMMREAKAKRETA